MSKRYMSVPKNTICLWYDKDAEEAARFYASVFPDSEVTAVRRAPADFPGGKKDDVLTVEFTVLGIPCIGLNGGPQFPQTEAVSFQIMCADQAEVDHYWNGFTANGGAESQCGWCKDPFGVSWQVIPRRFYELMSDPDPQVVTRVSQAMYSMQKLDVEQLERAARGE